MQIRDLMSNTVIRIAPEETVSVAARTLNQYNVGALPVCGADGKLCGMVTDRDLVIRCIAAGKDPSKTRVREVMTGGVVWATPDLDAALAARLMGRKQIRRLPVVADNKLCGMISLGDLANCDENAYDAGDALAEISSNVSKP